MKNPVTAVKLKYLVLFAGLLGAGLRSILYRTGTDEKGLLVSGHWGHFAVWALTALVAGVLIFICMPIKNSSRPPRDNPVGALCCFPAAVAFFRVSLAGLRAPDSMLDAAAALLGVGAAAALAWTGFCRLRGRRPSFLFNGLICVFFALRMVCQYRTWSSDPQLQDYFFIMFSHIALMLTAYHLAEFDADMGRSRPTWFVGLAAAYFSLLCTWGSAEPVFMLCCGLWALTNLPVPPAPRRIRPSLDPEAGGAPKER